MNKTYQLTNDINLTTPILCDGKLRMISFTGGMKNTGEDIRRGTYTTADEKVQKAIETDSGFGSVFHCITPVPLETAPASDDNAGTASGTTGSNSTDNAGGESSGNDGAAGGNDVNTSEGYGNNGNAPELTRVPGVTNKQGAIEWLAANKGINDLKPTCKVEAVRNAATLLGVEFPDWK